MRTFSRLAIHAAAALAALTAATPARVHPHVFAEARLDVDVDAGGNVAALKHVWRFDDVFSSTVLLEFDKNSDLKLDDAELKDVADTVYESLAEFNYFQIVTANGKDVPMERPERLIASFEDSQLMIMFQSQPKEPLKLSGKVGFGIYDPTFYTAIDFVEDDQMAVTSMPASCSRSVLRPDPDEAIAQNQASLTDDFFSDPTGTDLSKIFATRLELTCQG